MRIAIVGGGIAGALLAWRLAGRAAVSLYTGPMPAPDATSASGGLVRGFEPDPDACRLAVESIAELYADPALSEDAGYRETGAVYLLTPGGSIARSVRLLDEVLPGSARLRTPPRPFRDLPSGTVAVAERQAGYLSPTALRDAVLRRLTGAIHRVPVTALAAAPTVTLADGTTERYDAVVVAAGGWTPRLLRDAGLPTGSLRTKQIQYTVFPARFLGLGAFVDDTSGLYGRPYGDGRFLFGLPCDHWDIEPALVRPDAGLVERVAEVARRRLGPPPPDSRPIRTVASFDCYREPPGLALREVIAGTAVFTFTGGSGGAAKTVLAASRRAAATLLA